MATCGWRNFQRSATGKPSAVPGAKKAMVKTHVVPSKWILLAYQRDSTSKMYRR